jgi:uncharacterized protein with ACT and thioredoxin-like domain
VLINNVLKPAKELRSLLKKRGGKIIYIKVFRQLNGSQGIRACSIEEAVEWKHRLSDLNSPELNQLLKPDLYLEVFKVKQKRIKKDLYNKDNRSLIAEGKFKVKKFIS